ncbi:MAG: sigma-70 family RNA polymerase sigma factor [Gemmatimonadota bacterium]
MPADSSTITQLLEAHAAGDRAAFDRLLTLIYDDLRRIAQARLNCERPDHTLAATEVVHEAYLRLERLDRIDWQNRKQFFAVAARAMRYVLLDHAIRRRAQKRGGGERPVPLDELQVPVERPLDELIALGQALERLEGVEPRQARVVECRYFGGLTLDETADALDISPATVSRDWTFARAWLHRELADAAAGGAEETEDAE